MLTGSIVDKIDSLGKCSLKKPSQYHNGAETDLQPLPLLKEVKSTQQQEDLFIRKLRQCCVIFDFSDQMADLKSKEIKTGTLNELVEYISIGCGGLKEPVYPELIKMISINLFRNLPPSRLHYTTAKKDDLTLVQSWPHLSIVYNLFIEFLRSLDIQPMIGKNIIDKRFIIQILDLFDSEYKEERNCLKTVLHLIYIKCHGMQAFILKQIDSIFLTFVYETDQFNGVSELLDFLGHIIKNFELPLKTEHKQFLVKVLIPLYTVKSLALYHEQLAYCVVQFLKKDANLTQHVFKGLLKYWPKTCTPKEVLFLKDIQNIFSVIKPTQFTQIQEPLFRQIARCVSSPNYQTTREALNFLNNNHIKTQMKENCNVIMPIVFPALYRVSVEHWKQTIVAQVGKVLKIFLKMNGKLFLKLSRYNKCQGQKETEQENKLD